MYLELARETSTRKLYTDELQWSYELPYSLRTTVCFHYSEQKVEIEA